VFENMKKVDVYNIEGKKVAQVELDAHVFDVEKNDALLHQVYVAQAANRRSGTAHTKIRSEVRGGGRKPWRQKGTGNARAGSIRSPLWRGGGVIFGPLKKRNYTKSINEKMKQKALCIALSEKVRSEKFFVIDSLQLKEMKTKNIATLLNALKIDKSVLMGLATVEAPTYKAARNIQKTSPMETRKFNVYDVMNAECIVLSKDSLQELNEKYAQ
jgi:large subunit ribosomal protein L4